MNSYLSATEELKNRTFFFLSSIELFNKIKLLIAKLIDLVIIHLKRLDHIENSQTLFKRFERNKSINTLIDKSS